MLRCFRDAFIWLSDTLMGTNDLTSSLDLEYLAVGQKVGNGAGSVATKPHSASQGNHRLALPPRGERNISSS